MSTLQQSGYLATAASITWTSGQGLDSLANDEWTDLSDEIDNSTNKYMFADLDIDLANVAFSGVDSGIEVYLVPSVDGTNYPDWTGNATADEQGQDQYYVGFGATTGASGAQRIVVRGIELPPGKYKWGFRSRAGVALDTSGNSVSWRPHSFEASA